MFPFVPMLIGAALGGGLSAARGGNFLTGALLGGIGGGVGAGLLGSAGTAGGIGASTVGAALTPSANVATVGVEGLKQGLFAGGGNLAGMTTGIGAVPASAPSGFLANTMAGMGKDFTAVTDWAKANPIDALKGAQIGKNILFPEQQPMPQSAGLMRGQQMQQQAPAYAMARPQISLI